MNKVEEAGFLDVVPERLIDWEKDGGGSLAVLSVPRFRKGLFKKWIQPRLKRPYMKVKLDEIGTCVWENCDGEKTIREIGDALKEKFGEKIEPVDTRLKIFFSTLYKSQFVRYWQKADNK